MSHHSRVILLEVVPLLVLAALYLGVALALSPELFRRRKHLPWLGLGVWLVFVLIGGMAAAIAGAKLDDENFLGSVDPGSVLTLTLLAYLPAVIFIWR